MRAKDGGKLPVALKLAAVPAQSTLGVDFSAVSGDAAGSPLPIVRVQDDIVLLLPGSGDALAKLKAGDKVRFDNSNFLAVQTYHRHQVPGPEYSVWDQFRDAQGKPIYPQRPLNLGPIITRGASGTLQSGDFKGKMILVENLYDTEAFPWQADWYRDRVREHQGGAIDDNFRLWFTDHANHQDSARQADPLHTISYLGVLQQALRDVSAWVEKGVEPPASTDYKVVDGQVEVPEHAARRRGIQPVVHLAANGAARAEVKPGETVRLEAVIELPEGTGKVVSAAWDLDGRGDFPLPGKLSVGEDGNAHVTLEHAYARAGTWFPTLRVASQREGDADTPYARVQNLGRVRVVVQ